MTERSTGAEIARSMQLVLRRANLSRGKAAPGSTKTTTCSVTTGRSGRIHLVDRSGGIETWF
jgi:hypothetical protein